MNRIFQGVGLAAFLLPAAATAQSNQAFNFAEMLRGDGFSQVEVRSERGLSKVEGIRNGIEREVTFDDRTGAVVKDETGPADPDDVNLPTVGPAAGNNPAAFANSLRAAGFTNVELRNRDGVIKVEGIRDGLEREVRFDATTGALLDDETGLADADDVNLPTVGPAAGNNPAAFANSLRAAGFTNVELRNRDGVIKVEGIRDGLEREVRFDAATGALLDDETELAAIDGDDDGDLGRGRGRGRDGADDDDDDDDRGRGRGRGRGGDRADDDDGDDDDDRGRGRGRGGDRDDDDGDRGGDNDRADNDRGSDSGSRGADNDRADSSGSSSRGSDADRDDGDRGRGRGRGRGGDRDDRDDDRDDDDRDDDDDDDRDNSGRGSSNSGSGGSNR